MTESSIEQFPPPAEQPPARGRRRLHWIVGLVVALAASAGTGAAIAGSQIPADDNPTVQARLGELVELREAADDQAAKREQALRERADRLDERDEEIAQEAENLDKRETGLDEREKSLDERDAALDERESTLDDREKSIKATEMQIAENTVPGNGVYVVGEDIKAGTYKTAGPDASGADMCYYAFLSGTGSDANVIDNNIVKGQATLTLRSGQVFETSHCAEWKRQ